MAAKVVTRFAPSPTGFLHIGGARTALFNWLYAKSHGGEFHLRIEDTDRGRSTEEAMTAILDGMKWLELDWDGEVIYQHARAARHVEVANKLLETGHAYRCYATAEELTEMREKARAESRPPVYDGRWRDRDPSEAPDGVPSVVRFKSPTEGATIIKDLVQGDVTFQNENLDDLVILRGNGSPTYMLSVVVDDYDMGITHVIRGDDHLTNAARQAQIYHALDWNIPEFSHVPLIHGPDGAKLSKRHGALGVEAYRDMGYLPDALKNYLVRLGWAHGDQEIFSGDELIKLFGLDAIGRSAARFDFAKLENLNGVYIRNAAPADLISQIKNLLPHIKEEEGFSRPLKDADWQLLTAAMPGLQERAKTLLELIDSATYLFAARPLAMTTKADKILTDDARNILGKIVDKLKPIETWNAETTEQAIRQLAEEEGLKLGKIAQPLRAALTGTNVSPGIFDVVAVLGRDEVLGRLSDQATR